jgi:peptidoglycan/LPS O-acetylase OafA/YrhL
MPALTGARFFAALYVVFYHYGREAMGTLRPELGALASAGPTAVSFFYVLSGAVLTWGCLDAAGKPTRVGRAFLAARAARIAPAYWLALLLSVGPFAAHALKSAPPGEAALQIGVGVLACTLLVQAHVPQLAVGLNSPGWSVSCELFFYALWPRLSVWLGRVRLGLPWRRVLGFWLLAMLAPALGIAALCSGHVHGGSHWTITERVPSAELLARALTYFPMLRVLEFAIGVALGHALRHTPVRARVYGHDSARELALLGITLLAAGALGAGYGGALSGVALVDRMLVESPVLAPLFALWVWQLARGAGVITLLLGTQPLRRLGEASYGLYILQEPLLVWISAPLKRAAPALLASRWFFWLYTCALIGVSLLTHRFVEGPLRTRLARWLGPGTSA